MGTVLKFFDLQGSPDPLHGPQLRTYALLLCFMYYLTHKYCTALCLNDSLTKPVVLDQKL